MKPYLAYQNLIIEAETITAPDTPGYELQNAYDWFTYTWWRSSNLGESIYEMVFTGPVTVDYWGLAAHNMDTVNATIKLQYHDGVEWVDFGATYAPVNNIPILEILPAQTWDRWRFVVNALGTEPPLIGVLSLGQVLEFPQGLRPPFTPPPVAYDDKVFSSESASGQFLGRSVERFGYKITIAQTLLDPAWLREHWEEIAHAFETQPFFWSWAYDEYPNDTVYAWLDKDLPRPRYSDPKYAEFFAECRALHKIKWF